MERFTKEKSKNSQIKRSIILYCSEDKKDSCALPCTFQTALEWNRMIAAHCNTTANSIFWFSTMSQLFKTNHPHRSGLPRKSLAAPMQKLCHLPWAGIWEQDIWFPFGNRVHLQAEPAIIWVCNTVWDNTNHLFNSKHFSASSAHTNEHFQVRFAQTFWVFTSRKKP